MSQDKLVQKSPHNIANRFIQHIHQLIPLRNGLIIFFKTLKAIDWTTRESWHEEKETEEFPEGKILNHSISQLDDNPNRTKRQIRNTQEPKQRLRSIDSWLHLDKDNRKEG